VISGSRAVASVPRQLGEPKLARLLANQQQRKHRADFARREVAGIRVDESGEWNVYVTTFPGAPAMWQVSVDGGTEPRWRGDGRNCST
jgi:hypothetical protein